ncbi:MAG: cytochrome C [Geobacteraceae bacterium]|nr:cytochrome C [Geobacteraceae bacterium]
MHACNRAIWTTLTVFMLSTTSGVTAVAGPANQDPDVDKAEHGFIRTKNEKCMGCHGQKTITGPAGVNVYIDPVKFAGTSHAIVGCISCHDRVSAGHPGDGFIPPRAACGDCHGPIYEEYAKSLHGPKAGCNGCHNPHEVRLPVFMSGDDINHKCARCHDSRKTIQTHSKWLPQADLHIDALPCITCHTGSKDYVISMTIESRLPGSAKDFKNASYEELARLTKGDDISRLIDRNGDNLVSLEELRAFNHLLRGMNMRLWGMMVPEKVTHSYQILNNRWDCSFCHASGPKAMQKSFIAFPEKNGGYSRVPVEKGAILDILYGTPDFYMLGTTRSTALNLIGGLIVAAGLSFPLGHGFFRFLTRKNRKDDHHEA